MFICLSSRITIESLPGFESYAFEIGNYGVPSFTGLLNSVSIAFIFFFYRGFLLRTLAIHRTAEKGRLSSLLFFSTPTRSRELRKLFETFYL